MWRSFNIAVLVSLSLSTHVLGADPVREKSKDSPYVVTRVSGWIQGHEGFDPALPGYHLTPDIPYGFIELRSRRMVPPKKLVLVIRDPIDRFLSGLVMWNEDTVLGIGSVFSSQIITIRDPKQNWKIVGKEKTEKYFKFEFVGDVTRVTLLPEAMKLLAKPCLIRWRIGR